MNDAPDTGLLARPGQSLGDHLRQVAELAQRFSEDFGAGDWGRACGLLHDIGKVSASFQRRVRGENVRVDHSTAGARHAAMNWGGAGKLLAYCLAGHHGGLPDGKSNDEGSLEHRLDPARRRIESIEGWQRCLDPEHQPSAPGFGSLPFATTQDKLGFRFAFFLRMLFSSLVDADRLDAEAAGDAESLGRAARREGYPGIGQLRAQLDACLAKMVAGSKPTAVNRIRAEVLRNCRQGARQTPGLFSLTVPTGGGKTLSSLAFALEHAERHQLERVIYVIPFTSIIEQNAKVFRQALGDEAGDFVVEHHSNLVPPAPKQGEQADDRPHPATENWDAPVIVTTAVQFFESLFAARAGRCRKLHNLAKSVIILDEAQMLPLPYLKPCVEALRELTASYGASVVLCTATQPALNAPVDGGDGLLGGLTGVREIMPDPLALHAALKRVTVRHVGPLADADLATRLAALDRVLCIVPTRRMARALFDALRAASAAPEEEIFHLSALMCPRHRTEVLERIRAALKDKRPCRVVSTTLVEAGVDLDFPVVYRAEAGIDSIAQAAGRCNREGTLPEPGQVFVFAPEAGLPGGVLRRSAQAGQSVARNHMDDLLHPQAVREYFLELYWRTGEAELDAQDVIRRTGEGAASCLFPFREIERDFQLIDTPTRGLIIPFDDEGRGLVRALDALEAGERAGGLLRRLQRHTVSLYEADLARLLAAGAVRTSGPGGQALVLCNMGLYDERTGIDLHNAAPGLRAPEDYAC